MPGRVLLDTSTFLMASLDGIDKLSRTARDLIQDKETERILSTLTFSEIAIKAALGKLQMSGSEAIQAAEYLRVTVIPYTPEHAKRLFTLPFHEDHRDPFDRMLIATALAEELPLMSLDKQFRRYKGLKVIH